jgi:tetratricopeptide (TPR) repeat protein
VLQNVALNWHPIWHYAVVVGYDLTQKNIVLRSGSERRQVLPFTTFEHTWARAGHWAMLALPPGQISRTASEADYVAAAVALEKTVVPKSAEAAYEAALKRWPRNLVARIGAGNVAYALGNIQQAEQHFRQATLDHPESSIAFNNLAQTLLDQQRYVDALASANSAMSLGGLHQRAVQDTLGQIKAKMRE